MNDREEWRERVGISVLPPWHDDDDDDYIVDYNDDDHDTNNAFIKPASNSSFNSPPSKMWYTNK